MNQVNVSFAKIVATPTPTAWSQAYNAGNFFIVLSISSEETIEEGELTAQGKEILNVLEAELFGIESKNLASIKEAALNSLADIPAHIYTSLVIAYIKEQILYVIMYGPGNVLLKREQTIGTLLQREEQIKEMIGASGYIKQNDIIVLRTKQFTNLIPLHELKKSLDLTLPSDIAETLNPHVHNAEDGGAAAIILSVTGVPTSPETLETDSSTITGPTLKEKIPNTNFENTPPEPVEINKKPSVPLSFKLKKYFKLPHTLLRFRDNKKATILVLLALLILFTLGFQITQALQKRKQLELQKSFSIIYSEVEDKYESAIGIKSLRPEKANSLFTEADKKIVDSLPEFPETSEQRAKLVALQQKIQSQISTPVSGKTLKAEETDSKDVPILQLLLKDSNVLSSTEDEQQYYTLTSEAISSLDKGNEKSKVLISNENDWEKGLSLGTYHGNLYVLDPANGVIKFLVAENGYGKADYFTEKQDLSEAVSMAIDGSVWILSSDGTISKYTKGEKDTFSVKGLDPLKKPKQIITNADIENIYILDSGNNRIVQLQKDGTYKTSYRTEALANTKVFTISSDEKTIYLLNNDKILKLNL